MFSHSRNGEHAVSQKRARLHETSIFRAPRALPVTRSLFQNTRPASTLFSPNPDKGLRPYFIPKPKRESRRNEVRGTGIVLASRRAHAQPIVYAWRCRNRRPPGSSVETLFCCVVRKAPCTVEEVQVEQRVASTLPLCCPLLSFFLSFSLELRDAVLLSSRIGVCNERQYPQPPIILALPRNSSLSLPTVGWLLSLLCPPFFFFLSLVSRFLSSTFVLLFSLFVWWF